MRIGVLALPSHFNVCIYVGSGGPTWLISASCAWHECTWPCCWINYSFVHSAQWGWEEYKISGLKVLRYAIVITINAALVDGLSYRRVNKGIVI